jgi:hypothetical protein
VWEEGDEEGKEGDVHKIISISNQTQILMILWASPLPSLYFEFRTAFWVKKSGFNRRAGNCVRASYRLQAWFWHDKCAVGKYFKQKQMVN